MKTNAAAASPDTASQGRFRQLASGVERLLQCRTGHVVALVLLYLLFFAEYGRFVCANYSYMGFDYYFDPVRISVGVLFFVFFLGFQFFLRIPNDRLYALGMLVALFYVVPNIVMFQLGEVSVYGSLYALLFHLLITCPARFFPSLSHLPKVPVRTRQWLLPLVALLLMVPFFLAYGFSSDFSVFGLGSHTYEVRQALAGRQNVFTNYLFGPVTKIFLPLLIICGLGNFRRRWWMTLLGVLLMLYLFVANPQKSLLFSIAVIMLFWLFKSCYAKAGMLLYGLALAAFAAVGLNLLTGSLMAESLLLRRVFFLPVEISDAYFAYFDGHPLCLSHSFLGAFFDYPYDREPAFLVGYLMNNLDVTRYNTGIIGDGFMNFGHLGSLLFVTIGALVLRFIDAADYDSRYFGMVFLLLFTFLNGALFTALLTHAGLLLILAILFLIPSQPPSQIPSKSF